MKVSSRERILLLTTALVIVAVSLYLILEPRLKDWKALETELLLKRERLSLALKTLEEARIEGPIRRVSMCHSAASMMERLDTLTKEDGIKVVSIEPLGVEEEDTHRVIRVNLKGSGSLSSLTGLLNGLKGEGLCVERLEILAGEDDGLGIDLLIASIAFKDETMSNSSVRERGLDPYYRLIVDRGIFGSIVREAAIGVDGEEVEKESVVREPVTKYLLLKGITFDGERYLAVIEDIRVRSVYSVAEGSSIKGARVLRIDPNRVVLEEEGKELPLILR